MLSGSPIVRRIISCMETPADSHHDIESAGPTTSPARRRPLTRAAGLMIAAVATITAMAVGVAAPALASPAGIRTDDPAPISINTDEPLPISLSGGVHQPGPNWATATD